VSELETPQKKRPEPKSIRGVTPAILLQQVKSTAPFIFTMDLNRADFGYIEILRKADPERELSHFEYYTLCLAAHYATVATFVPTDVDNQIRSRLWSASLSTEILEQMADLILTSHRWDTRPVSARWIASRKNPTVTLGGHDGEWLSTAAAAYGALRKRSPDKAAMIAGEIVRELQKSADLFQEFKLARDGVSLLITSALIAHNLGDLDRVLDIWAIDAEDPLRLAVYKTGHVPSAHGTSEETKEQTPSQKLRFGGHLLSAGQLNKSMMALENHRHFALRLARPLRRSEDFLIGIGPFFDTWGARIASHPTLTLEEKGGIAEALIDGFEKLATKSGPTPVGYARALAGMLERFPGGLQGLCQYLPAKLARTLKAGPLRTYCVITKTRYEEQMSQTALKFVSQFTFK
jgi:hypothetical protein